MFFKKKKSSYTADLQRTVQALEAEIEALENNLKKQQHTPQKPRPVQVIPPSDRRKTYRQERALHVAMTRHGRTSNVRRELRENSLLLLLLIGVNLVFFLWFIRLLVHA